MTRMHALISRERRQYQVYLGLSFAVLVLTGLIHFAGNRSFDRFIGRMDPLPVGLLLIVLGGILLTVLLSRGWFAIYKKNNFKGVSLSAGCAAVLGMIMLLADLKIVFPPDTNVPFPFSLLFYPAVGFFAEILFHVLPLTVLLLVSASLFRSVRYNIILLIAIVITALPEPVYQIFWMGDRYPLWAVVFVGFHVFVVNLLQLLIFKRYDFVSMYSFRLVYYLFWHIGWGYLRIPMLFS